MVNRVLYQAPQAQFISEVERNLVSQKMRHTAELAGIHSCLYHKSFSSAHLFSVCAQKKAPPKRGLY